MPNNRLSVLLAGCLTICSSAHALTLSSPAFEDNSVIPDVFTYSFSGQCSGANQSPPLVFSQVPAGTQSLALVMRDPDGGNWLHWKAWNIAPTVTALAANAAAAASFPQAANDFGTSGYGGPCPPTPNHRYTFTLFALNQTFITEPTNDHLLAASLATATLTGFRSPGDNLSWTAPDRQACLFNWFERQFPEFISPRGATNQKLAPFTFRYYSQTQSYLGHSSDDQHIYFLNEPIGLLNLGAANVWAAQTACP